MGKIELQFGLKVRQLRESYAPKLTREALSEKLGVTATTIYRWENSLAWPNPETLERIADFFKIPASELLGQKKAESPTIDSLMSIIKSQEQEIERLRAQLSTDHGLEKITGPVDAIKQVLNSGDQQLIDILAAQALMAIKARKSNSAQPPAKKRHSNKG